MCESSYSYYVSIGISVHIKCLSSSWFIAAVESCKIVKARITHFYANVCKINTFEAWQLHIPQCDSCFFILIL